MQGMPTDFKPGDAVTITGGTFETIAGNVAGIDADKVLVRLLIFGRMTDPVSIDRQYVRLRTSDEPLQQPPRVQQHSERESKGPSKCKWCGNRVPFYAEVCPHCGQPNRPPVG